MSESQVAHKTVIWTAAVVTGAAAVGAIVYWAKRAHVYEQYVPIKVCERCLDRRSSSRSFYRIGIYFCSTNIGPEL